MVGLSMQGSIVHVAMEGYGFNAMKGQGSHAHSLGEAGGVIKLVLHDFFLGALPGYPSIPVPQQIKKFASGKGNSPKDQVSKEVFRKWGVDAKDNNQADAYVLARIALALVDGGGLLSYEQEVIDAMKKAASVHAEAPGTLQYEARL